ncbi:MAG: hypothetical protein IPN69_09705 [Acidobacteria bacterium]|nr:hypothetical protein [Acidobacteriota bacterium]
MKNITGEYNEYEERQQIRFATFSVNFVGKFGSWSDAVTRRFALQIAKAVLHEPRCNPESITAAV